jgi:hypothetical protein
VLRWVLAWLLLTFVCFQWSEGRLGPRAWLDSTLGWVRDWTTSVPPAATVARRHASVDSEAQKPPGGDGAERALVVAHPSLTEAPRPALPTHTGSFPDVLAPVHDDEPLPQAAAAGIEVDRSDRDLVVHAGPGCERAKRRYAETFLDESEDPEMLKLLGEKRRYAHCKPELMSLRLCVLVHRGEAIGVTVQSEPPNRVVSTCAAIVAKLLHYPVSKRPRLVRTEITFE